MAVVLKKVKNFNAVRIISEIDGAVDHDNSNWDKYKEDPIANENVIKFKPNQVPTIFLCNFELKAKEAAKIKDSMMGAIDEDKNMSLNYGNWGYWVAKLTLKEIQNPPGEKDVLELKKDSKGYVSEETLNKLESLGIIKEIFLHYIKLTQTDELNNAKN